MLMRREYAPERSPTSFSNGGGLRRGSDRRTSSNSSAFFLRPLLASFRASFWAGAVKTTLPFRFGSATYQPGFSEVFDRGVFKPLRIEALMPGIESR